MKKSAQILLEFVLISGLALVFLVSITYFFSSQLRDEKKNVVEQDLFELGSRLKQELEIARYVENGYNKTIVVPLSVDGENYSFEHRGEYLTITWEKTTFTFTLPKTNGTFKKGTNYVVKNESGLYIFQ